MSTADVASRPGRAARAGGQLAPVRHWLRLLRSELGLVFGRRRNIALLVVLAAVPVLLGIVLKVSTLQPGNGGGNGHGNGRNGKRRGWRRFFGNGNGHNGHQRVPLYLDPEALRKVLAQLSRLPPLVTSWEIENLKGQLAEACRGERFLLQGGDCSESFDDCE